MKIVQRIINLFSSKSEQRSVTMEDLFESGGSNSSSGVTVTEKTALQYAAIWRAVSLISSGVAKLPLNTFRRVDTASGEGKEKATDHPAYRLLLRKPAIDMTAYPFKQSLQNNALVHGNGYALILRDGAARPTELIWLDPTQTTPIREGEQLWYMTIINNVQRRFKEEDILHIKGLGFDGMVGYSAIKYGANTFGSGIAMQEYGTRFFKNSAVPNVVLEHPKALSEDAAKRILSGWNRMLKGVSNSHKAFVSEEDMKVKQLAINAKDAQLVESRKFSVTEIATWFGVPAHKLGSDAKTSYSSLEQENLAWLSDTLAPWLETWEQECWDKLLTEEEKLSDSIVIEFNVESLLRGDIKTTHENYQKGIASGYLSINEVRAMINKNPIEGGDVHYMPLNMTPIGEDPEEDEPDVDPDPEEDEGRARLIVLAEKVYKEAAERCMKRFEKQIERARDKTTKRQKIKAESEEYVRSSLKPARDIYMESGSVMDYEKRFWEEFSNGA